MAENKLSNAQKKEWAKQLFMQGDITQKDIAIKVGIAEKTMGRWVEEEKWDVQRKSLNVTTDEIIRDLLDTLDHMRKEAKIAATDNDPATKPDSDGIYKMSLAIRKLQDKTGIGDTIRTMMEFIKFVMPEDHALAQEIAKYGDLFIESCLKRS